MLAYSFKEIIFLDTSHNSISVNRPQIQFFRRFIIFPYAWITYPASFLTHTRHILLPTVHLRYQYSTNLIPIALNHKSNWKCILFLLGVVEVHCQHCLSHFLGSHQYTSLEDNSLRLMKILIIKFTLSYSHYNMLYIFF